MILPQTAEYALRAMACIALKKDEHPVNSTVLARATGIPGHYLSKIMRKLVEADLVVSRKGHGGGFKLSRSPEEISFREILETVDYSIDPDTCVFGWEKCSSSKPCPLHNTWSRLKDSYRWWAENMTLGDVVDQSGESDDLLIPGSGGNPT